MQALNKTNSLLVKLANVLAVISFTASTFLITINIFHRHVISGFLRKVSENNFLESFYLSLNDLFGTLSVVSDEIPGLLLVWITFSGCYLSFVKNQHINFDLISMKLEKRYNYFSKFIKIILLFIFIIITFFSIKMISISGKTYIETLDIEQGWFMIILPIAFISMSLKIISDFFKN